ncbi:putative nuclease HARBI1 [Leptopilina boulardi]|uniref:putative nuclease HARBI1 n=1 Tax=Leptopilina boulardi TaxID=63433 RepID=UPI0021F549D1|nr:putative nuclease HARBI1 [Leptopilina boulardi]
MFFIKNKVEEAAVAAAVAVNTIFDDDEQEDEEFEDFFRLVAAVGQERVALPETENYFEIVVPRFLLSDFKSHFRMSRTTFEELSLIIGEDLDTPQSHVAVMKKLAVAFWYFGNLEVYRSLSDRFGISKSTAWECVIDVAKSLCARAQNFIHWPTDQEIPIIQQEFYEMANFPGVIGAIDGSHIKISSPH